METLCSVVFYLRATVKMKLFQCMETLEFIDWNTTFGQMLTLGFYDHGKGTLKEFRIESSIESNFVMNQIIMNLQESLLNWIKNLWNNLLSNQDSHSCK